MSTSLFGWELLYKSVQEDVKNDQDVLVCFVHLVLVSNGFKCIGLGDSKNIDGTETKSEHLPKGWNDNYAIRYVYQGRLFNLRGTNMDDAVMINLIRVQERTVSMVQLNTGAVAQRFGSLDQMLPNNEELAQTVKQQLIDKVAASSKYKDGTSQTAIEDILVNPIPYIPNISNVMTPMLIGNPDNTVGGDDLDPLGRFGGLGNNIPGRMPAMPAAGGMLFVPPRNPQGQIGPSRGIPPGSLPPGARFDPFRPPGVDHVPRRRSNRPDNDDLLPPGYDDMFM